MFLLLLLLAQKEVAITIDDLPFAHSGPGACEFRGLEASTRSLLAPLAGHPFTGFVIGTNCPKLAPSEREQILRQWLRAGGELGNHTQSHPSYTRVSTEEYTADIARLEPALRQLTGKPTRWFRSPMLHTGDTEAKKDALEAFLKKNGLRQAPVTLDNSDWMFSYALTYARASGDKALEQRVLAAYVPYLETIIDFFEKRAIAVVGRPVKHIMLLHANQLNAEKLADVMAAFRRRGYRIISLADAVRDPAYQLPDRYAGNKGISIIHRWGITKGLALEMEPDEPAFVREAYEAGRAR